MAALYMISAASGWEEGRGGIILASNDMNSINEGGTFILYMVEDIDS